MSLACHAVCSGVVPAIRALALAAAVVPAAARDAAAERTNVVILFADDLGYGDLGCYGHETFQTPRIDRMAAEGVRLTDFYSSCPYCAPARAALQTGRYQYRSGMVHNPFPRGDLGGVRSGHELGLPESELTLGEAFRAAGYRTMHIGKWHLGHQPRFYPTRHGYDEYFGILYSNDMHPVELREGEEVAEYPVVQATLTRRYTERACEFIRKNAERTFFLYLAHAMPHKPLACSEAFYKASGHGLYADVIAELDWSVGQVLDAIREAGLDERTLVFFTSDNGPWYGGSTGGLRGMKGRTFEGGIRVPLIARWPGRIPPGRVSREPAILMDLFTTSLRAADIEPPSDRPLDGRDILPLLAAGAKSPHEALFSMRGAELSTVRSGKWKLHVRRPGPLDEKQWRPDEPWVDPRGPDGVRILAPYEQAHPSSYPGVLTGDAVATVALFDLEEDPAEQRDVAGEHPEVVSRLRALHRALEAELPR